MFPEKENRFPEITLESLKKELDTAGYDHPIPYEQWGSIPGSKPLEKLLKELQEGDSGLSRTIEGKLVRIVEQVGAFVFAQNERGEVFLLKEDRQEFTDRPPKVRSLEGISFREKANIRTEGSNVAIWRGFEEELPEIYAAHEKKGPFDLQYPLLRVDSARPPQMVDDVPGYIPSYPGLPNQSFEYRYTFLISPEAYKPEGYSVVEGNRTTYFVWEKTELDHPFLPLTTWQRMTQEQKNRAIDVARTVREIHQDDLEIIGEYLFLKDRVAEVAKDSANIRYGSSLELEHAANNFRIMFLEKELPFLRALFKRVRR